MIYFFHIWIPTFDSIILINFFCMRRFYVYFFFISKWNFWNYLIRKYIYGWIQTHGFTYIHAFKSYIYIQLYTYVLIHVCKCMNSLFMRFYVHKIHARIKLQIQKYKQYFCNFHVCMIRIANTNTWRVWKIFGENIITFMS